jgi:hypothetical protein
VEIALGLDVEINQPMTGNLIQHVIEKRDAGLEDCTARAVQIDPDPDAGLGSMAFDFGNAGSHERNQLNG